MSEVKSWWVKCTFSFFGGTNSRYYHQVNRPKGVYVYGPFDTKKEARDAYSSFHESYDNGTGW